MAHLSQDEIEAVVTGTSSLDEAVRSHLRECPDCAARLTREARFEVALRDTVSSAPVAVPRPASRGWKVAWAVAAALAIVASGAWFVGERSRRDVASLPVSPMSPDELVLLSPSTDETPGLIDPLSYMPGYTVQTTELWLVAPAEQVLYSGSGARLRYR